MLTRKFRKRGSFFEHYFLLYILVIAYLPFVRCSCLQGGLMPKVNLTLADLPKAVKEQYFNLMQMLNDDGKERLEKIIHKISVQRLLKKFIEASLRNHTTYNQLIKFLPKPERAIFKQDFAQTFDINDIDSQLDAQTKLIAQCSSELQVIQHAAIQTQQHYIDLLEILPDDQAIALKNKIVNATNADEVSQLIASQLPAPFKQLHDSDKENFSNLPSRRRQKLLQNLVAPLAPKEVQPDDGHAPTSADELYAKQLLEQEVKEHTEQQDEDKEVTQDEWRSRLPLRGEQRKEFLLSILPFKHEDRKSLKSLFNETNTDSIEMFLLAYFDEFNERERIELLRVMIHLYQKGRSLTVKLCNTPDLLTTGDEILIAWRAGWSGTALLTRLQNFFSS